MGCCISGNTKTLVLLLVLLILPVGTPILSCLAFIQQFLACPEGADSSPHRIPTPFRKPWCRQHGPCAAGSLPTSVLADLDANQKSHPRCCTVAQKAFQLCGNG